MPHLERTTRNTRLILRIYAFTFSMELCSSSINLPSSLFQLRCRIIIHPCSISCSTPLTHFYHHQTTPIASSPWSSPPSPKYTTCSSAPSIIHFELACTTDGSPSSPRNGNVYQQPNARSCLQSAPPLPHVGHRHGRIRRFGLGAS